MLSPYAGTVLASGNPPSVDAGPAKAIAFPAKDLTLFGHATDPENDPLTVQWTQVSGPVSVTFSAPKALASTVTFTTTGTYVFQLAVSDGTSNVTSSVTVTVNPASSQTAFYVDPTFTGVGNGSAQAPWTTLGTSFPNAQWTAINNALAIGPVIVYFSTRQAGSDTAEEITQEVNIWRTDTSTNRLTLDGMSKYNTNDTNPSWVDYTGSNKMRIRIISGSISIGVQSTNYQYPMHYTTIRGFETTGGSGRVTFAGNYSVLEYMWVHDITITGATVQFQAAVRDYPTCTALFGNLYDITLRNNLIERGEGEGIYIAGTYTRQADGGCLSWGNTHSDILIESNTIRDPGYNGGEGDSIDLKAGLLNVTVRNNTLERGPTGTLGITSLGVFAPGPGNYLIEQNRIFSRNGTGIRLNKQIGTVVRNNVISNNIGGSLTTSGDDNTTYWLNINVQFYNNTLYGNGSGVVLYYNDSVAGPIIKNNIIFGNSGYQIQGNSTSPTVTEDYNIYSSPGISQVSNGARSLLLTDTSGLVVDAVNGNFHLLSTSPAIDIGTDLSAKGFATDFDGVQRPQGAAWDIGAYEFGAFVTPKPPTNLRIIP
jgi:hypothetical protein